MANLAGSLPAAEVISNRQVPLPQWTPRQPFIVPRSLLGWVDSPVKGLGLM
jgi:hypothetical protein